MAKVRTVKIDGREHAVEWEHTDDGCLRVSVDGRQRILDAVRLSASQWLLREGTTSTLIDVDGTPPKATVTVSHPTGEPRTAVADVVVPVFSTTGDGRSTNPAASGSLRAQMPGKIVKVLAKVGDWVRAGQSLIIVEAMKMENELRAPRDGRVSAVHCTEGNTVEANQELIGLA